MNAILPSLMTVDEFLRWSQAQEHGHYELERGRIVAMNAENAGHAKVKVRIYNALGRAIEKTAVPFYALPDGPRVRIPGSRSYEPDVLIAQLPEVAEDALEIPNVVAVFEVLSPTPKSVRRDLTEKVVGYALVPSIEHYIVIDPEERAVLHYRRRGDLLVPPNAATEDVLRLESIGIEVPIDDMLGPNQHPDATQMIEVP